ncbi:MAG TPA: MerR family transcriptional regulator [Streptosporangiaceae bacterium]|nr:MerR family transcriptional regulator [Streptosporangiaceae bacterium]
MTETKETGPGLTIDELARQAQVPVRTIREYHTMRLLPPPQRRGRIGVYGPHHAQRLELIARLQRRGYSLAGIRDLLQAWDAGTNLSALLGVEPAQAPLDETPLRLTQAELPGRLPALTGPSLRRACSAGLIQPDGEDFLVRSPALLALVADGTAAGIPLDEMLDLAGTLGRELTGVAEAVAGLIVERMLPPLEASQRLGDLSALFQRGRHLLLQAAASTLADRLATALLLRSGDAKGGAELRAAVEHIRVGAVADSAGNIGYATRGDV